MDAATELRDALHLVVFMADSLYEHEVGSEPWQRYYDALNEAISRYSAAQDTYDAHEYAKSEARATRH